MGTVPDLSTERQICDRDCDPSLRERSAAGTGRFGFVAFPKPSEADKGFFADLVETVPGATVKPMFGNAGGFLPANNHMFLSLFGDAVSVRLKEDDRAALLEVDGTAVFEPMAGRPMKEYISFPATWRDEPDRMTPWIERSVAYVEGLPPKKR